jgi:thiol-disulfide isomerase/thioredoxin
VGSDAQAAEKFGRISEAYSTLVDVDKRAMYDNFGGQEFTNEWDYREAQARGETGSVSGFYGPDSGVLSLQYDHLTIVYVRDTLKKPLLVEFYAPWCVHCQHLAPSIRRLALLLQDDVAIGAVNCDSSPTVCQQEQVQAYPTLRLLMPDGSMEPYKGELRMEPLEEWILGIVDDKVVTLDPASVLRNVQGADGVWVIQYTTPWCQPCQQAKGTLRDVAQKLRQHGVRVGSIDCQAHPQLCQAHGASYYPFLKVVPAFSSSVADMAQDVNADMQQGPGIAALNLVAAVLKALLPVA